MAESPYRTRPPTPQILQDLDDLDPVDQAKVTYSHLRTLPGWQEVDDTQRDALFKRYQPGGAEQLIGPDLSTARQAYEAQQQPPPSIGPGAGTPWLGAGMPEDVTNAATWALENAPGAASWTAKNVAGPAGAAWAGRAAAAPLGPLAAAGGGMAGAGIYEYGRQKAEGEEFDPWKIGGAAITEGIVGPVIGLYKTLRHGVPAVLARRASKVKAAKEAAEEGVEAIERRAAGEVRPAVTAAVPRQGDVTTLFSEFEQAMANRPPAIPAASLESGLVRSAQKFPAVSEVPTFEKLNSVAQRLRNLLTQSEGAMPTGVAGPGPLQTKIEIADAYQQLKQVREEIRLLPKDSAARSELEHLRGLINKDLDAYAAQPGAHPAARLLRQANQASRAEMAVDRVHEVVDKVLYAPDVVYGPKQAVALAKALRTDKELKRYLNDPSELDALVNAASKIGGRSAEEAAKIRAAIPEPLPSRSGGGFGAGTGAGLGAAVGATTDWALGGAGLFGGIAGTAIGMTGAETADILRRVTPEMLKEAKRIPTTPRAKMVASALLHSARGGIQESRERELASVRQLAGGPPKPYR